MMLSVSERFREQQEACRKIGEGISKTFAAFFNGMAKITFLKPRLIQKGNKRH